MEKLYSEEEQKEIADLEKSRTISDAKLLKGGAEYVINENGEKENLLITHSQIESVEALGRPYYQFMAKHFTNEVLEDIVKAAEGYSRGRADRTLEERWLPLLEQVRNDPNYKDVGDSCLCVECILRGLAAYDNDSFGDLYERAQKAGRRLSEKVSSEGWSWSKFK